MCWLRIGHRIAPYASSVPHITLNHTLAQYRTSHSTIRALSTAYFMTSYASSVPHTEDIA
eukprot:1882859-Rhodomonas_salina.1